MPTGCCSPEPLYRIGQWAEKAGLTDYYGVTAEQLNDDLLGRALERLAKYAERGRSGVGHRMIKVFKVQVNQIHFDITDVELYGAYEQAVRRRANPAHALAGLRSHQERAEERQADRHGAERDGRRGRAHRASAAWMAMRRKARFTWRTCALWRRPWARAISFTSRTRSSTRWRTCWRLSQATDSSFAAARSNRTCKSEYLKLRRRGKLQKVDYFPQSQARLPADKRDQYKAVETKAVLKGTVDGRTVRVNYRLIFVWSEAKARQEAQTRERHMSKIREEFEAIERNLNKYSLTTPREDSGAAGIGQSEVHGRQPVRVQVDEGPQGPFSSDVEDQRQEAERDFSNWRACTC